jgi:RNA polymerase sigma-70 factor, ECF subfamily
VTGLDTKVLWSEFHRPLGAFLARRVRRDADVDDLLQEVFVRIHRRIDTLAQAERVDAWIFQIARNALIDFERVRATRNDARQPRTEEIEAMAVPVPEPEEGQGELAACLRPMIATLPEPYREALRLTEIEGLTQAEAASRAGVSLSGMKSRVQRGRERLKTLILDCCHIELDARGGVMDCQPRCTCTTEKDP